MEDSPPDGLRLIDADHLAALANHLREHEIRVSVQQCLLVRQLFIRLATEGKLPEKSGEFAPLLAPVFCSNAEQQHRFPDLFAEWWMAEFGEKVTEPLPDDSGSETVTSQHHRKRRWQPRKIPALLLGLMLLALLCGYAWNEWQTREVHGIVTEEESGSGMGGVTILGSNSSTLSAESDGSFTLRLRVRDLPQLVGFSRPGYDTRTELLDYPLPQPWRITLRKKATEPVMPPPIVPHGDPGDSRVERTSGMEVDTSSVQLERDITHPYAVHPRTHLMLCGLPFLLIAGFGSLLYWLRHRHTPVLERITAETPRNLREVKLAGGVQALMPRLGVRELARDLRRRRTVPSRELDVPASISATLQDGGIFSPVFRSRAEPDYLLLIDRASLQDHQAAFADAFADTLEQGNVSIQRWYFDGEPLRCRHSNVTTAGAVAEVLHLDELVARHPDHRVLMFSDGEMFIDRYTGTPRPWVETLRRWQETIILTMEHPERWGNREAAIARLGLAMLPATRAGIAVVSALFGGRDRQSGVTVGGRDPHHQLTAHSRRWLDRDAPSPDRIEALCSELASFLGPVGFQWLAACAVYPEVHWGITLRLGSVLIPDARQMEELLPAMARVIWLREAFIPDWLRGALLHRLDPVVQRQVRSALEKMLGEASLGHGRNISLKIALDRPQGAGGKEKWWRQFVDRVLASHPQGRFRHSLHNSEADSPMRDHVFLHFMSGQKIPDLGLAVPSWFARLLHPRGLGALGFRPAVWIVTGLLVAGGVSGGIRYFESNSHRIGITRAAFSVDGKTVITGAADGTVRFWDKATGKEVGSPLYAKGSIQGIWPSPNGEQVLVKGASESPRFWNIATRRLEDIGIKVAPGSLLQQAWNIATRRFENAFQVAPDSFLKRVDFSSDGSRMMLLVYSGNEDTQSTWSAEKALVFETATGEVLEQESLSVRLGDAAMSPDGKILATEGTARSIMFLEIGNQASSRDYDAGNQHIAISRDSKFAATASDGPIGIFKMEGIYPRREVANTSRILQMAFSPDGSKLAVADEDNNVSLLSADDETTEVRTRDSDGIKAPVTSLEFSPDGQLIVAAYADLAARVWSTADGSLIGYPLIHDLHGFGFRGSKRMSATFDCDGDHLLTFTPERAARLWKVKFTRKAGLKVLLIACNYEYSGVAPGPWQGMSPLEFPIPDVRGIASALHVGFGATTTTLINRSPREVMDELDRFQKTVGVDDSVILVLAGAGNKGKDGSFSFRLDTTQEGEKEWTEAEIAAYLKNLPARAAMLIADTSGDGAFKLGEAPSLEEQGTGKSRTVLTNFKKGATIALFKRGIDTQPWSESLIKAFGTEDGHSSGEQFVSAVRREVLGDKEAAASTLGSGYGTFPAAGHEGGDFIFPPRIAPAGYANGVEGTDGKDDATNVQTAPEPAMTGAEQAPASITEAALNKADALGSAADGAIPKEEAPSKEETKPAETTPRQATITAAQTLERTIQMLRRQWNVGGRIAPASGLREAPLNANENTLGGLEASIEKVYFADVRANVTASALMTAKTVQDLADLIFRSIPIENRSNLVPNE